MVVCKYFQQGTCRYGQYCRFQHINNFGGNQVAVNKQFADSKNIVLGVAEEVLAAERGGQWLLSCFGPFKEQPSIPGMDDVSPEEVRWEMYQAQKTGTVDQTKLQFQQLCQAMTAKREALKNPTHETAAMLDKLQKSRDGGFGTKTNFALSTPQMPSSSNTASTSSVFGGKSFTGTSNPFGSGFSSATSSGTTSSIFGRPSTASNSVFGSKPSFGGNAVFGAQSTGNSVFGGATNTSSAPVFGGNQSMQSFQQAATSTNVFGATTFGSPNQPTTSPFGMAQPAQSTTSVFGTTTTATNSPFGSPSSSLFGAAKPTPSIFGAPATIQPATPFGAAAATTATSPNLGTASIFGQPKNTAAFGGAPVFGAAGGFGSSSATVFGSPPSFDNSQIPASNVFGVASQATTFGSSAQPTNSFGALAAPSATPFGAIAPTTNVPPFGATSSPFGTSASTAFGAPAPFGASIQPVGNEPPPAFGSSTAPSGDSPFGPQAAQSVNAFGTHAPPPPSPFGAPVFGNSPSTPFASTTSTTTTSNPFAPRSQQQMNTPFGMAQTTSSSATPFGQSSYGSITTASVYDESAYTLDGKLTDDEKKAYLSDQFILGKIPVQPPTIELR